MPQDLYTAVDNYLTETLIPPDSIMDAVLKANSCKSSLISSTPNASWRSARWAATAVSGSPARFRPMGGS
jgi:hypothetical protein